MNSYKNQHQILSYKNMIKLVFLIFFPFVSHAIVPCSGVMEKMHDHTVIQSLKRSVEQGRANIVSFEGIDKFKKDFKKLIKKYKSLEKDLINLKSVLDVLPERKDENFSILKKYDRFTILKVRVCCDYLKSRDMRLIYIYFSKEKRIVFIELYYKGDKVNQDEQRIRGYLKENQLI